MIDRFKTVVRIQGTFEMVQAAIAYFQTIADCALVVSQINSIQGGQIVIHELSSEQIYGQLHLSNLARKFPKLKLIGWSDLRADPTSAKRNQLLQFESGRSCKTIEKRMISFFPEDPARRFPKPLWWTEAETYRYQITRGKTIRIERYFDCATQVTVPHQIEGLPVSEIGPSAFASNPYIQKILLPPTARRISKRAFAGCLALTDILGLEQVTRIESGAFKSTRLESNPYFCKALITDQTLEKLFYGGRHYVVPSEVSALAASAFCECPGLRKITLSDTIQKIDPDAFTGCTSLKELVLTSRTVPVHWHELRHTSIRKLSFPDKQTIKIQDPREFDSICLIDGQVKYDQQQLNEQNRLDSPDEINEEAPHTHRFVLRDPAQLSIIVKFKTGRQFTYNCPFKVKVGDQVMVEGAQDQTPGTVVKVLKNSFDNAPYVKSVVNAYRMVK